MYALYDRSRRVLAGLLCAVIACITIGMVRFVRHVRLVGRTGFADCTYLGYDPDDWGF